VKRNAPGPERSLGGVGRRISPTAAGLDRPVEARQKFDRDLLAALDKLGFDVTDDKIAEIKGDMTIRLLCPFDGLLKFVVGQVSASASCREQSRVNSQHFLDERGWRSAELRRVTS
jgi:hypothetical protein